MNQFCRLLLLLSILQISLPASALEFQADSQGPHPVIIELFTSQGCSSCPPADAWLSEFSSRAGLWRDFFPMAFHVSYWDYLGWKDPFAAKDHGQRQYSYWLHRQSRAVYTPQIFVNGREWLRGQERWLPSTEAAPLKLKVNEGHVSAEYAAEADALQVAIVGMGLVSVIEQGENRGKNLRQDFVVLASWHFLPRSLTDNSCHFEGRLDADMAQLRSLTPRLALVAWTEKDGRPQQAVADWLGHTDGR